MVWLVLPTWWIPRPLLNSHLLEWLYQNQCTMGVRQVYTSMFQLQRVWITGQWCALLICLMVHVKTHHLQPTFMFKVCVNAMCIIFSLVVHGSNWNMEIRNILFIHIGGRRRYLIHVIASCRHLYHTCALKILLWNRFTWISKAVCINVCFFFDWLVFSQTGWSIERK